MKQHLLPLLLPLLLLTGCTEEHISHRLYTQTLGISGSRELTTYGLGFGEDVPFIAVGSTAAEAFQKGEAAEGRPIFLGHTELLCLDGTRTLSQVEELLFTEGLSPGCKLLYTDVAHYFSEGESLLETIRMSEQNGLLPETDLAGVLHEWLGERETALLPAAFRGTLCMTLLHTDGSRTLLSAKAAQGLRWLRGDDGEVSLTLETPEGTKDAVILRSSVTKRLEETAAGAVFCFQVTVELEGTPDLADALHARILDECRTAAAEMTAARADVIGLQELAEAAGSTLPDVPKIAVLVEVRA